MAKTITIDAAVVSQVRVATDSTGAIHVFCDYTLNSGNTIVQALGDEVTAQLDSGGQSSALALFTSALAAVNALQGVAATWPAAAAAAQAGSNTPPAKPEAPPNPTPSAGG